MLQEKNQKLLDEKYPDGYKFKKVTIGEKVYDERDSYHILFVKILPDGKRTRDVMHIQKFGITDWMKTKASIEAMGIAITQYDEYDVLHDPVKWKNEAATREEEEAKIAKAAAKKAEATKKKAETAAKVEAKKLAEAAAKKKEDAEAAEKKGDNKSGDKTPQSK